MSQTLNNGIPFVPENTIDPAAGLNEAINHADAITQLHVLTAGQNVPPAAPQAGERHIVGTSPSGAWAGKARKVARYQDSGWAFFNARIAVCEADKKLYAHFDATGWEALT